MEILLSILLSLALFATVVVLATGIISFAVHGEFYLRNANKLMRLRVLAQGVAITIFAIILLLQLA
ncbi:MAG: hypothetical protein HN377_10985 [Alphaproteobacteria bacterium]|jgi:hypothetical protein|nr:hypothetical protein [Alphaproteobacteria bacterium]